MKEYDVDVSALFEKRYNVAAEDEKHAKNEARRKFREEDNYKVTKDDFREDAFKIFDRGEIDDLSDDPYERFMDAVYEFCDEHDKESDMVDEALDYFDAEIDPFNPFKKFYYKQLYTCEKKYGEIETAFSDTKLISGKATLIDIKHNDDDTGTGYELWLTDDFKFIVTLFAEQVLRNGRGEQVEALRYRKVIPVDFYNASGIRFHSEDFIDILIDKVYEASGEKE